LKFYKKQKNKLTNLNNLTNNSKQLKMSNKMIKIKLFILKAK